MMEFEIKGVTYQVNQLDAVTQFHVIRRLASVLGKIIPVFNTAPTADSLAALEHLASAISEMSDDDANYCIFALLKRVKRKQAQGLGWAAVTSSNKQLIFDDIDMTVMLQLVVKAMQFNFTNFLQESPLASKNEPSPVSYPSNG